jgi:hypothetical protein
MTRPLAIWLLGTVIVLLTALAILLVIASRYQPLVFGEVSGDGAEGLPTDHEIRYVNSFAHFEQDVYVPPHQGRFGLTVSIMNDGPMTVTIEGITLPPGYTGVALAGPVLRFLPGGPASDVEGRREVLRPLPLDPSENMLFGLPLRVWPCGFRGQYEVIPGFVVRERFLWFTRTVTLPFDPLPQETGELIVNVPARSGQPGIVCGR